MDSDTNKLLKALSALSSKGPIAIRGKGSNVVGKMLQEELGIKHDTKKKNRLYGYTISSKTNSRPNLFACVANWDKSELQCSNDVVTEVGKPNLEKGYELALFCTVSALGPNSFGLYLKHNVVDNTIEEWLCNEDDDRCILVWDLDSLYKKLEDIGRRAFVNATKVSLPETKAVHYRFVGLVDAPKLEEFANLITSGAITLDHLISKKVGQKTAREQGPMFKITPDAVEILHGPIKKIDLMDIDI